MSNVKVNDSVLGFLRSGKNLKHMFGANSKIIKQIQLENSVCCGIGRKKLKFVNSVNGLVTKVTYPLVFNGNTVNNKDEFSQEINNFFGVGYISYLIDSGNVGILSSPYLKENDGTLNIPDSLTVTLL